MAKQVIFKDLENDTYLAGVLLDDSNVLCGCCGSIFEADERGTTHTIIKEFDEWMDIQTAMVDEKDYEWLKKIIEQEKDNETRKQSDRSNPTNPETK